MAFRIWKFNLNVDRAAFDREEWDVDVTCLERFGLLVSRVDHEHLLREVRGIAVLFLWLLDFLWDVDSKIFIDKIGFRVATLPGYKTATIHVTIRSLSSALELRTNIIESDSELSWRIGIFARDAENHSAVWDHLNAVVFALINHSVTIIRRYDSIKQLVHNFNLHVSVL